MTKHVIERSSILEDGDIVTTNHLPLDMLSGMKLPTCL